MNEEVAPIPSGVRRIAVLGPAPVGDFVFTLPMLQALRRQFPDAELLYLGRPWQAEFLAARPGPIDRVVVVPPLPGIGLPPDAPIEGGLRERFIETMRSQAIDVAVQAYGGGRYSNPFVAALDARLTAGLRAPGASALDRCVPYARLQNRRLLLLELAASIGARDHRVGQELQATPADRAEAGGVLPAGDARPLVVIQPGANDARRRWPARRFAAVADVLASEGAAIAINGTRDEAAIVREVIAAMRHEAIDLAGQLTLRGLCGLLDRAALLVSNDTGPLHLAVAIGTPAVGIYWLTNLVESQPLRQHRHRAALATRVACPVCGLPNLTERCPHDESFVAEVAPDEVIQAALELFKESRRASGRS